MRSDARRRHSNSALRHLADDMEHLAVAKVNHCTPVAALSVVHAQAVYNGEADFMQGGADIKDLGGLSADALSGAFDEPLSKGKVLAIAKLFIKAA